MKPWPESAGETIRPDRDAFGTLSKRVDIRMIWSGSTCADDPAALGLYLPTAHQILVNLKNVYREAVRIAPEPEGSLMGTIIHLQDMCLIHELIHWGTGGSDHHDHWNHFILEGLIMRICEERRRNPAA
jgi:hypothetical protein